MPKTVILYSKADCHLCHEAQRHIEDVRHRVHFDFTVVDITTDASLDDALKHHIPIVTLDGNEIFRHRVNPIRLEQLLRREDNLA